MIFKLNDQKVANGTVLLLGVKYIDQETGRAASPQTYTYAALKVRGRWYLTGAGRVPQDAGWGAVARWLDERGRQVEWIKVASGITTLWERSRETDFSQPYSLIAEDVPGE